MEKEETETSQNLSEEEDSAADLVKKEAVSINYEYETEDAYVEKNHVSPADGVSEALISDEENNEVSVHRIKRFIYHPSSASNMPESSIDVVPPEQTPRNCGSDRSRLKTSHDRISWECSGQGATSSRSEVLSRILKQKDMTGRFSLLHDSESTYNEENSTTIQSKEPVSVVTTASVGQRERYITEVHEIADAQQPIWVYCSICKRTIQTEVSYDAGLYVFLMCFLCCVIFPFLILCAWIPFLFTDFLNKKHNCPRCGTILGICKRVPK